MVTKERAVEQALEPTETCPRCGGVGLVHDDRQVGRALRKLRVAASISLRDMARHLDLSPSYISDLELGRRTWREKLVTEYLKYLPKDAP